MRVTQTMLSKNTLRHINQGYDRLSKIQDQLASGKKITRASQDPVAAMSGMRYRSQVVEVEQFSRNLTEMYNWMEQGDSALSEVTQALQRIRELTVQASNDTYDETQRGNIAKEISQLRDHIASIGNTQVNGKYIFNGTNTSESPVDLSKLDNFIKMPSVVEGGTQVSQIESITGNVTDFARGWTSYYTPADPSFTVNADLLTNVADGDVVTINFPELPELPDLPATRSFTGTVVGNEITFDDTTTELQQFYDYYSTNNGQLNDIKINYTDTGDGTEKTADFSDVGQQNEIVTQLTFTPADLGAHRDDEVSLEIGGTEYDFQYNSTTGNFEWDIPEGKSINEIESGVVTVKPTLYNFDIKTTEVDNPDDYYVTVKIDGKDFKLDYYEDEVTGESGYRNELPIRTTTPLEELEQLKGTVVMKPDASPTSTNEEEVEMELLKGVNITSNIRPQNVFSNNFFKDLNDIVDQISNLGQGLDEGEADHKFISSFIDKIDVHIDKVVSEQAELGARMNRIELMEMRVMQQEVTAKRILSENEDADMEDVIINLKSQESVHQAALAAGARIIQPTLLDFLR